jgi:putative ABC transport system permease protein
MNNIWFDLKYAWRLLNKSRGYAAMCASVVALSVGLTVWTNALTYSQMLKPVGYPGTERWYSVQLHADAASRARPSVDAYTYQQILKHNRTADHLGAFVNQAIVLSEGEATTSLRGGAITPRLFSSLQAPPLFGRVFNENDGQAESAPVAILSFDTWQNYFAGDRNIIGKTVRFDTKPVQIVGVMPESFLAFRDYEVWIPLQLPQLARPNDSTLIVFPMIALGDNQTIEPILNEMNAAVRQVNGDHPQLFHAARRAALIPANRIFTHGNAPIALTLSFMAAAVLILGGVNISMVFLARLLERSRELALRSALGASRGRLLRQCLLETALVVIVGLVAGYGLAAMGIEWTHGISEMMRDTFATGRATNLPELRPFDFLAAVIAATAVWLLSTLIPAWRITNQDAATVLAGSGKGAAIRGSNRSVAILVGLQVVISSLVLVAAGNVVLAVKKETSKPSGLHSAGITLSTDPTTLGARYAAPEQRLRYWDELTASIASRLPGAEVVFTSAPPTRPIRVPAAIETQQSSHKEGSLMLPLTAVSENYFEMMGIRLRSGRLFDRTDNRESLDVAIVDENMAARFWPNEDALGKRVRLNTSENEKWMTIVGIVSTVPGSPYRIDGDLGTLYQPLRQAAPDAFHILVKSPDANSDARDALRAAAFEVDRDLPLHNLQPFAKYLEALRRGTSAMIPIFTIVALITALLAASGLFGLISRSVAQRTQEVGIRRALGATAWRATSMFLRKGALYLSIAIVGLGLGILIMPMLSRAIPNILDHVVPVTAGVVLLMAFVISTASYLPTRRALDFEPGDALRYE